MKPKNLLYLHGFRSSPASAKARQTADWMQRHHLDVRWHCPQLPASPRQAVDELMALIDGWPAHEMAVIGSSLGGFYATVLAERTGCRAALLNPAVNPARDLAAHIGQTTAYHSNEAFFFRPEFVPELQALTPMAITQPARYLAVIARGDEVLDWREMAARYAHGSLRLLDDGDHALSDYAEHLPHVMAFLGLPEA